MDRRTLASWPLASALLCAACPGGANTDDTTGAAANTTSMATTGGSITAVTGGDGSSTTNVDTTSVPTTGEPTTGATGTTTDATTGEPENLQSSVSQYGVTWTFDAPRPVGRFVTGDWWVVGPVTIVSVVPAPTADRNGTMLDPVNEQDYDSRAGEYLAGLRVAFPAALEGTHSLVSSISHPEAPECMQGGSDGWLTYDGDCQRGPIHTQAILTIVDAPQPADAFRPPYAGPIKPIHRANDLCWSALPRLAAPQVRIEPALLMRHIERPWIDHLGSWTMQHGCATHNMFCYGREVGNIVATLASYVLVDSPEQQELARKLVQLGIDNYGVIQAGGGWGSDGGHFNGRKFPIVFAGAMLGDAAMTSPGVDIGNEDAMTYLGENGEALWGRDCDDCYFNNGCGYSGECQNGSKDCRDPAHLVDGCEDYRNCCTSVTWVGEALAVHAMGLEAAWGHDPWLDYVDRWVNGEVEGGGDASNELVAAMWELYRNTTPAVMACP